MAAHRPIPEAHAHRRDVLLPLLQRLHAHHAAGRQPIGHVPRSAACHCAQRLAVSKHPDRLSDRQFHDRPSQWRHSGDRGHDHAEHLHRHSCAGGQRDREDRDPHLRTAALPGRQRGDQRLLRVDRKPWQPGTRGRRRNHAVTGHLADRHPAGRRGDATLRIPGDGSHAWRPHPAVRTAHADPATDPHASQTGQVAGASGQQPGNPQVLSEHKHGRALAGLVSIADRAPRGPFSLLVALLWAL